MSSSAGSPGSSSTASAPESKATSSSSSSSSSGSSSNSAPPPSSNSNSNNNNNNNNNGNGTSNIGGSGNNSTSNTNNDNSGNNTNNNNANNNNSGGGKSNNDNNKNNDGKNNSSPASPPPSSSSPPPASPPPSNSKNGSNSPSPSPSPPSPPPSSPPPSSPPPSSPSPSSPPPSSPPPSSPNSNQSPPQKSSPSSSPPAQSSPPTSSPPNQSSSQPSPPPPNAATTPPGDPKWSPPPPQATPVVNPPPGAKVPPNAIPPPVDPGASTPKPTPVAPPTPSNSTGGKAENSTSGNSSGGSHSSGSSFTQTTILGATVAGVFVIALIAIIFVVRRKKKKVDVYPPHYIPPPANFTEKSGGQSGGAGGTVDPFYGSQTQQMSPSEGSHGSRRGHMFHATGSQDSGGIGGPKSFFTYEELMEITNGFSRDNILGEGGFGCVYKGWLPDGKVVAVKQLKAGSGQGEREFRAEVEIISRVHHRHLVSLVGYCISEQHRLLIYEFVPNKTLEHHLHGRELPVLEWSKRVKIAVGAAKGLAYLHEDCHPKIIHRDIKSANILLDDSFEAQVADFGLAKLNDSTQTHVSTRVMGTFGYLAPEYASSGKLTDRSDVFSFGVVLLELITGRKPVDPTQPLGEESLVEWARPVLVRALETGDISEVVDPRLEKHYVEGEVFRMIEAATACVRHSAPKRPRMVQVVRALDSEGDMSDLSNGVRYGQSTMYDSGQYNHDIMKFRKMALGCDDSSEFSADYTSGSLVVPTSQTSSEFTSGESETRAMTHAASKSSYGHHF